MLSLLERTQAGSMDWGAPQSVAIQALEVICS
jgi:hypothetical protein